jgi:DNA modification methylase
VTELTSRRRHLHPFPARMAPEVALDKIRLLTKPGDVVLDPMCGSGTVVRLAADQGRHGIGVDLDPLAVLITRATCTPSWSDNLEARAKDVVRAAKRRSSGLPRWIEHDPETRLFVSYWFGHDQLADLSRLARVLLDRPRRDDPLRIAFSRLIVTKDAGASLARDTSHSRPHRVRDSNDFNVMDAYIDSARKLEALASPLAGARTPSVRRADARHLRFLKDRSIDLVVTSPPYLNAIDYLRGHRMSLVWMGWTVAELREIRGGTIGAERGFEGKDDEVLQMAHAAIARFDEVPGRQQRMVLRFVNDMDRLCGSLGRVIKKRGHLVVVVADSQLRGIPVENAAICTSTAKRHGFEVIARALRPLPTRHRYLPPPSTTTGAMSQRMKEEVIFTFRKN